MKHVLTFLIFLCCCLTNAQSPDVAWQNRIGGSNWDVSYKSVHTSDGGFIIGGRSNSNISGDKTENSKGGYDYWIVKTNSEGIIEWDRTLGAASPTGNESDWFYDLIQTPNGGYLIGGYSDSPLSGDKTEDALEGTADFWIIKTNNLGVIEWENTIGGSDGEQATTMANTLDNGFIVGGDSTSPVSYDKSENCRGLQDYWVVKLDNTGAIIWDRTYGGSGNDLLSSIVPVVDGGYLLAGRSNSNISGDKTEDSKGFHDYWLIKIDAAGNQLWQKTIGGSGFEYLSKTVQTSDSGFFLAGYSDSLISGDKTAPNKGGNDYWVIKIDSNGIIEWQQTYGGSDYDALFSAQQCIDGGYILSGNSSSNISGDKTEPSNGGNDAWLIKINSSGVILWQRTIGGNGTDGFNSVSQTIDGGYFFSGGSDSNSSADIPEANIGIIDYWIMKLDADPLSVPDNTSNNAIIAYPNPVMSELHLRNPDGVVIKSMSVYNILGQLVITIPNAEATSSIDVSQLETGAYFLKINSDKGTTNAKFVKN